MSEPQVTLRQIVPTCISESQNSAQIKSGGAASRLILIRSCALQPESSVLRIDRMHLEYMRQTIVLPRTRRRGYRVNRTTGTAVARPAKRVAGRTNPPAPQYPWWSEKDPAPAWLSLGEP